MTLTKEREFTAADAAYVAGAQVDQVVSMLKNTDLWEPVRYATWQHRPSGLQVKTRYCYGEGRIVICDPRQPRGQQALRDLKMLGRDTAAVDEFVCLFPVSGSSTSAIRA